MLLFLLFKLALAKDSRKVVMGKVSYDLALSGHEYPQATVEVLETKTKIILMT
jgi:hypothetical protein